MGVRGSFDRAANYTHAVFAPPDARSITVKALVPAGTITVRPTTTFAQTAGSYSLSSAIAPTDVQGCELTLILLGTETQQQLKPTDCVSGSYYSDEYNIGLPVGATLTVEQSSTDFDAYISLLKGGSLVASDDDSGGGSDALLTYTSTENLAYVIYASSFAARSTGSYTLRITLKYPTLNSVLSQRAVASASAETNGLGINSQNMDNRSSVLSSD